VPTLPTPRWAGWGYRCRTPWAHGNKHASSSRLVQHPTCIRNHDPGSFHRLVLSFGRRLLLISIFCSSSRNTMATPFDDDQRLGELDGKPQVSEHGKHAVGLAASMSPQRRLEVEKTLKRKLDVRCAYFIVIYIMNCACPGLGAVQYGLTNSCAQILTATTSRLRVLVACRNISTSTIRNMRPVLVSCTWDTS